ncbi:1-acyl-sn-glycerol-3-phosphate acyltransferase, partial [Candidatus Woesearchaeota archaeon]|nr:1-acyl-sn-glycerol-3-phosphate acyltransferase [Candidatus Woesearchaeota archaeon]
GEEIHAVLLLKEKTSAKAIVSKANQQLDDSQNIQHYSIWHYENFPRTTTMKVKKFVVKQAIQKKAKPVGIVKTENKVHAVVSRLAKKKVAGNATLQSLGLSSVDRIELASLLEQEFSIEIDEEKLLPSTKVKDVEKIVKQKKAVESRDIFRRYALHPFVRLIRFILKSFILHPFVRLFSWPSVKGKENLKGLKGPVIFASNHQSHFDTPVIFMKLPLRFSLKIAVAAWQEFFFTHDLKFKGFTFWLRYVLSTVTFNLYPLPQSRMARKSMEYTGYLLDKGWSILIFPEGTRSTTGKVSRFMQGIGMLAVEMQVPVVPVRIDGMLNILPRWRYIPWFGRARLKIGKPLMLKRESYLKATEIIEKAVKEL